MRYAKRILLAMDIVFDCWPTVAQMAKELKKPYTTVASWKARGSTPARHDIEIVEAARARGGQLTLEQIASARAQQHKRLKKEESAA